MKNDQIDAFAVKKSKVDFKMDDTGNQYLICVPVSGGRDSQTCLALAVDAVGSDRVIGLFCDTQFEHPTTYEHIDFMRKYYNVRIDTVTAGSVAEKVDKYKRFPGGGARHCTDELKITPSKKFYSALAESNGGFEVWYGIRGDEGHERQKRYTGKVSDEVYLPNEFMKKYPKYLGKKGVMMRLPIIEWGINDITQYLDGKEGQLYDKGFNRTGCFPCMAAGDAAKLQAFTFDETGKKHYKIMSALAEKHGLQIFRTKTADEKTQACDNFAGCSICAI